jgi:alpha-glucuronidase
MKNACLASLPMKKVLVFLLTFLWLSNLYAEDGYRLWLRYEKVDQKILFDKYLAVAANAAILGESPVINAAKTEMSEGLKGLLGSKVVVTGVVNASTTIIVGKASQHPTISKIAGDDIYNQLGNEGFYIGSKTLSGKRYIVITANEDQGVLYGVYHFLRLIQTRQDIQKLNIVSVPDVKIRVLNHWDNLDRTVERGYAGFSIWDWHKLPDYIDPRYKEYARANASIGINGTVLTNVNANATVMTKEYLPKVQALASVFRPYGIKVYLTAKFSAPIEIGGLKTADPLNEEVRKWWKAKADEIYSYVPDFGGFLVKANSEGQPGPQNYGRNHADGANMLADALQPHGGIVIWRAFVYSNETPEDRFKQAYNEFKPLDGQFHSNVLVQVKNGPIDFQPREPFHPLFGAMPKTPLMMEFQLTQEYLGFATHLVYLAPMFKETLDSDTYAKGKGSTVAKVIDGTLDNHQLTGMAGVANIGNDRNWCGHPFAQSNWYAFGRLAWNHSLSSETIADEWTKQTFSTNVKTVETIKNIMLPSREVLVDYMTPLGLNHIMGYSHHYGPAPWYDKASRADWNPVYFHKADSAGIGFDRTATGSNALEQYEGPVASLYGNLKTCPEDFLLWFHRVGWNYRLQTGNTLWNELCLKYNSGVVNVQKMQNKWKGLKGSIDAEQYEHVSMLLDIQVKEAIWWRDACISYFQSFSKQPVPAGCPAPAHSLDYYKSLRFPYAPGI